MTHTPLISSSLATAALACLALAGCANTASNTTSHAAKAASVATAAAAPTVLDVAAKQPQLSTFVKLVKEAGLTETLGAANAYTVFAPSDDAFKAVPAKTLDALLADKAALKNVLSFHVLPTKVMATAVKPGSVTTAQGEKLELGATAGIVTVGDAMVTQADLGATNGVIHVIDRVLIPAKK